MNLFSSIILLNDFLFCGFRHANNVVVDDLIQLEKEQMALQSNEGKLIENCLEKVSALQAAKTNNQKTINELTQCYIKTVSRMIS